jgi:hypothetical protein
MIERRSSQQSGKPKPQRQPKMEKKQKNLYLSAQARHLLTVLSLNMGISETAVVELLVREKAARENISLPSELKPTIEDTKVEDTRHDE